MKRLFRFFSLAALVLFVAINLLLGYWGISSILLTIIMYALALLAGRFAIAKFTRYKAHAQNFALLFTTVLLTLFAGELLLKYVFKVGLERQELNGEFFYTLPYEDSPIDRLARKYGDKMPDYTVRNSVPNSCDRVGREEFVYAHTYNSLGIRGDEPEKDTSRITIATLGDSFTEGIGTPQDSTWTQLLQNNFTDNALADSTYYKVQCINGGATGSDPFSEYFILKKLLLPYHPKMVIVAVNSSDMTDVIKAGGWERYDHTKRAPWWGYIYQFSFVARAVAHATMHVNWLLLTPAQNEKADKEALEKLEKCLTENYLALAREQHFQLVVVLHPMLSELEENRFPLQPLFTQLQQYPEIKTIHLYEAFRKEKQLRGFEHQSLYWPKDGHNNSTGYHLWADIVYREIKDRLQTRQ